MSSSGEQTLEKIERWLWPVDMPIVLHYGDSHLTRFKPWINTDWDYGGPTDLDHHVLSHRHFCAVGGSTFKNIHDRVRNINVPPTQPFRGDLWRYTINVKELKPDYILVSLGTNDASNYDRHYRREMEKYRRAVLDGLIDMENDSDYKFCNPDYWLGLSNTMQKDAKRVFDRLQTTFSDSKVVYVGVIRNPKWCDETNLLCDNLEWYISRVLKIKLAPLSGLIDRTIHIRKDDVHLTELGYRLFMDKVYSRLMHMWVGPLMHKRKVPVDW